MKIVIVIPAYNEEKTIGKLIDQLKNQGYRRIIVVDDGSEDRTYKIASSKNAEVFRHIFNRGLGGALRTGFAAALKNGADLIVTMDADLQHSVSDIPKLVSPVINKEADVVIGSRMLDFRDMPLSRRLANKIANFFTWLFFGLKVTDSQSGFRCFSKKALAKMDLTSNKMEISSEIIQEIKRNNLRLKEIPIKSIYTSYSLSKGQNLILGIKTLIKLILLRTK
jgi:glycosyltransferase involved in cell wall biosynthesis